jgi:adenine phosphoribosyltransferase
MPGHLEPSAMGELANYLQLIDTTTTGCYDVTPLFANYAAFAALLADLDTCFRDVDSDVVAGIDALGFILGTGLALRRGVGFVPVRKSGKLPGVVHRAELVDYAGARKTLELRDDAIRPGTRVLIVDEWIETGAQVMAAIRLIEGQGGVVVGVATIQIEVNERTRPLRERYDCRAAYNGPAL